jgi:hypothetical protein
MTDTTTLDAVEERIELTHGGEVEITSTTLYGAPALHMHVETNCNDLTAVEAVDLAHRLLRGVDVIGWPDEPDTVDAPAPVVVTRVLPSDDLIFIGVRA